MKIKNITIIVLLQLLAVTTYAQSNDNTAKEHNDSLLNATLGIQTAQLVRLDSSRRVDSVKQAGLEEQVNALKTTDNLKKQQLLSELTALRDAATVRQQAQKKQIDSLKRFVTGYPVSPFGDTLFYVYTRVGAFTPQARADAISEKIRK